MQFTNVAIYGGTFNQGGTFNHFDYIGFESNSKILQLLRPKGYIDYFAIHQNARLRDTCHWSMSHPTIYTWLTSDASESSRLWLHGNPGTGKSVLAAFLIEQIQMNNNFEDQIVLPYFCKAAGSEKDKAVHVLMAFIRQCLSRRDHPYDMDVATRLAQKLLGEREDYKFTLEEMEPYLSLFLAKFTKIWFVVDGIDECEDATSLIDALGRLETEHSKVLLTSRKENHILEQLRLWPSLEVGAEETTAIDIEVFIDEQVRRLIQDRPVLKSHANQLIDHLRKATGVMFLYARLKCETIKEADPSTEAQIAEIFDSLDGRLSGLDALYENYLLQRLASNNKYRNEVALRTLQWIKCAPRPVTSTFLFRALALDLENDRTISSANLDFGVKSTISKALGVLVEWQGTEAVSYATLIHHSLRDYLSRLECNPPQWEELPVPYNSIVHEPAHMALLAACCIVIRAPLVWNHLQGYHDSADQRRKLSEDRPKALRRQLGKEQPWDLWEQRQRRELDEHWTWRKEEAKSAQSDLTDIPDELESLEWVKNRRKQFQMIQTLESQRAQELHQLVGVTTMRERDLMIYSFEYLAYHLAEVGKSGNVRMTDSFDCLIPQMRIYAANIFSDIDPTEARGALQAASLVDLAIALASFAETMDLLEQLIQYNPTNVHHWRWIFSLLHLRISRFLQNHQASNAAAITWDPAILQSFKTKGPPLHLTQLFTLITIAINDLRGIEYALCNYDNNVSALIGAGIFIHALRHFERLLAQWMIFHSLEYMEPHLLSRDHLLFPKILTKPVVRPMTQTSGKPVFSHPKVFLALMLCLVVSAWNLHPLRMAIIFSFSFQRSQYSFQPYSPFWTVYRNIPLLLPLPIAHWLLSECSVYQLVLIAGVVSLFVAPTTRALRSGVVPAFTKQMVNRFLTDQSVYESYLIVYLCYRVRPLATQLNIVLIFFFLYNLLISIVDPTGLRRARAYYCGDVPIQTEDVHSLVQTEPGSHP